MMTAGVGGSHCSSGTGQYIGAGNLIPIEYMLRYKILKGLKTSRGVLRWNYMTTKSSTSTSSSLEEFWNCAGG